MARLLFDAEQGCYQGTSFAVSGAALLRRIASRTAATIANGVDPVDAAERAWSEALDEDNWQATDDGVRVRSALAPKI